MRQWRAAISGTTDVDVERLGGPGAVTWLRAAARNRHGDELAERSRIHEALSRRQDGRVLAALATHAQVLPRPAVQRLLATSQRDVAVARAVAARPELCEADLAGLLEHDDAEVLVAVLAHDALTWQLRQQALSGRLPGGGLRRHLPEQAVDPLRAGPHDSADPRVALACLRARPWCCPAGLAEGMGRVLGACQVHLAVAGVLAPQWLTDTLDHLDRLVRRRGLGVPAVLSASPVQVSAVLRRRARRTRTALLSVADASTGDVTCCRRQARRQQQAIEAVELLEGGAARGAHRDDALRCCLRTVAGETGGAPLRERAAGALVAHGPDWLLASSPGQLRARGGDEALVAALTAHGTPDHVGVAELVAEVHAAGAQVDCRGELRSTSWAVTAVCGSVRPARVAVRAVAPGLEACLQQRVSERSGGTQQAHELVQAMLPDFDGTLDELCAVARRLAAPDPVGA